VGFAVCSIREQAQKILKLLGFNSLKEVRGRAISDFVRNENEK